MAEIIRELTKEDLNDFWEIVVTASGEGHSRDYKEGRVNWFSTIMDEYKEFGYYGLFRDDKYQVEIILDVSDFSSLIMGAIDFKTLFNFGLAEISDENYLDSIHRIFYTEHKPICITDF
jgi:hypothetical protein